MNLISIGLTTQDVNSLSSILSKIPSHIQPEFDSDTYADELEIVDIILLLREKLF